jgi:SPP1 gp7 family putative phage head morphogenesis protein
VPPELSPNKQIVSPKNNGSKKDPFDIPISSKSLEANDVFPLDAKSAYVSSYFPESYDFPYNPDPLASNNNYSIYDEMKTDDQVKAAISFKKDQIIGPGWQIKCENEEIVETVERNLKETLNNNFENSLRDILSSFEYGFSLTEPIYRRIENGIIELKELKTRPPHGFEFHLDDKGDVLKIMQNAAQDNLEFKPDYFLHHVYQPEFGNPFGRSDLNAAHTSWKAKKFIFRFWAIYCERFAAPTVVAEYTDEFDPTLAARLQTIMNTIQNSTNIIIPQGVKLDFKMANRDSSNVYENAINVMNTMIARSVLMPDLMGVSGAQSSSGSRALGEVQFELFMGMIGREQESLSRAITRKIITPMVRANWGEESCAFEFKPRSKDDALESYKLWVEATKSKIWDTSEEEIKHLLEGLKFPVPESITITKPEPNPFDNQFPPKPGQPRTPTKSPNPDQDKNKRDDQAKADLFNKRTYREETKFEKLVNFGELKKTLTRIDEVAFNRTKPLAKDIYLDFIEQIRSRNLLARFKPDLINELTPKQLKPLNVEFKNFMKGTYSNAYNQAQKEIFPRKDKKFEEIEELLPEEFLEIIEAEAFKIVGDYSIHVTNKMKNELMQGIKNGIGERELLKSLKELGAEETDKWLKTVIRTKTTEMFNRGRKAYWETDELAKQIVEAYQFSAIMDDRTSEVCASLDGNVYEKGNFTNHIVPPLHFNCRSLLIPITKFEEYETDKQPSLDSLKDKGGNLIFAQDSSLYESEIITEPGMNVVLPEIGEGKYYVISEIYISNVSKNETMAIWVGFTDDDRKFYEKILRPTDSTKIKDVDVPEGMGLIIGCLSPYTNLSYTCKYVVKSNELPPPPPIPTPQELNQSPIEEIKPEYPEVGPDGSI